MKKGGISTRRRELEEKFFHDRDQELLQALREKTASQERKKALAEASGISDAELLDRLDELDVSPETLAALSLVPLIAVAWADGKLDDKERKAVLEAAAQKGIDAEHPASPLLKDWLRQKPAATLVDVWKLYAAALAQSLDEASKTALKDDLLGRAGAVAEAAGGLLGFGNKVSKSEQAVLDELEQALG